MAAIVGDNHNGVQAAISRVEQEDPGCLGLRCACHSFQLLLEDVRDLPPIRGALQVLVHFYFLTS